MQIETSKRSTPTGASASHDGGGSAAPAALYAVLIAASFVGAGLLFSVQPMVAKMLLPLLGGSAAVWNTAMVFFQVLLLGGYAYAHFAVTRLRPRSHRMAQIGLIALPLIVLPIAVPAGWDAPTTASPLGWTLFVLLIMVGAPFFALATLSPTLQRWLAETDHAGAANPYVLYSASNAGSLLSLLAYPIVLEPLLDVPAQAQLWTGLYGLLIVLVAAAAWLARPHTGGITAAPGHPTDAGPPVSWRRRGFWVYAAFVPSALMLGVTRYLSTDVASFPLLWVVPLAIYLLTFVVAFRGEPVREVGIAASALRFAVIPAVLLFGRLQATWLLLTLPLVVFAAAALMAHGRLMLARPAPARLTEFYLWISIGGAAGGVFASLVAPTVFDQVLEYPIALALALTLLPAAGGKPSRRLTVVAAAAVLGAITAAVFQTSGELDLAVVSMAAVAVATFVALRDRRSFAVVMAILVAVPLLGRAGTLRSDRTFFGVYRVHETPDGTHVFTSGTTIHGSQRGIGQGERPMPTSYYHRSGPIGQVLAGRLDAGGVNVAVIGLGAGSLAAYAGPDDHYTFYEIDPVVLEIAADPGLFTYLAETEGTIDHVIGDGRLMIERSGDVYDVIVLDAFTSDAIPTHLVTLEAMASYADRLADDGVIAVHVSNRHLDMEPVVGRVAAELGLVARSQFYSPDDAARSDGAAPTRWIVVARSEAHLGGSGDLGSWAPAREDASLWTDSYTSIFEIFNWD